MSRNKSCYQNRQPIACCAVLWCYSKNNLPPKNPYSRCGFSVTSFCFSGWNMLHTCRVNFFNPYIACIIMFSFCVMVENLRTCKGEVEIRLKEQVQKIQPKSLKILRSIYKRDKKEVWKLVKKKRKRDITWNSRKSEHFTLCTYIFILPHICFWVLCPIMNYGTPEGPGSLLDRQWSLFL